jgi:hypothetical protein
MELPRGDLVTLDGIRLGKKARMSSMKALRPALAKGLGITVRKGLASYGRHWAVYP